MFSASYQPDQYKSQNGPVQMSLHATMLVCECDLCAALAQGCEDADGSDSMGLSTRGRLRTRLGSATFCTSQQS